MERTLDQWLQYQMTTHTQAIAMGLTRVEQVAQALGLARPARHVITVGGTNGKGSTVAFIEAIARAGGLRVGAFTSPHLLAYNERVRIDGSDASDAALIAAFERIEAARGETPLTYFEFGTLAALVIFADASLDLAVLEVGLGGRLDAVNIVDADVSVITTVDIDHQEYLGIDREAIGADKAGIFRAGKPCVLAERDPPSSVLQRAYELGAPAIRAHADYLLAVRADGWTWHEPGCDLDLPLPALSAPAQLDNAAAAIAALRALPIELPDQAFADGVAAARVPGRLQVTGRSPEIVVDVAHNVQAAEQLAEWLARHPMPTLAVFSALKDKDIEGIAARLDPYIQRWFVAGIHDAGTRGLSGAEVAARLAGSVREDRCRVFDEVASAFSAARAEAGASARVLVFGSFHTAAEALKADGGEPERV